MTASSTLTPAQDFVMNYSKEMLREMMAQADLTRRVEEELFPTELGDEFIRNSVVVANDGQSFTIRARNSFSYGPRGYCHRIEPGDTVKFDRFFNIISVR